ncbi:hypothetical protein GUITHDRAFT_106228 [Guillardia theta CCMP2712]|uniref:Large ribosomal subunit protein bL32m n=1 Tax=Guillardia theta (strain CCMP2712) TaxID=905079 RepID=L1JIJ6_GUITC|nr:hypothetical protein GUITHDRAFT_106228 [Guillardia theta CCMP2712]EKX48152.1 hypothetical protein GUITHDRAFT_106228 [Guillardia theta CCMP2712]|eukprot:XP_005835132.1 hypothetical protein GUITHDRAFT_106228 [Guillardia theta CCMP2712]
MAWQRLTQRFAFWAERLVPRPQQRLMLSYETSSACSESAISSPSLPERLSELLDGLWFAVPKKRVSAARRDVRNAPKALNWDYSIVPCKKCGKPRRPHRYCDQYNCARVDEVERPQVESSDVKEGSS